MTAVIVWAFGQPDAVDLGPLVFSLAAVGGTAVIGNRRLLDARPGPVVRAWIATALLGILAIVLFLVQVARAPAAPPWRWI